MRLPTVMIQAETALGYMIINESDFDASIHKLYEEAPRENEAGEKPGEDETPEESKEEKTLSGRSKRGRQVKPDETDLTGNPFE